MTTPRSTLIAIQLADLLVDRRSALRGMPEREREAILALGTASSLVADYERAKALEATESMLVSHMHACAVCYPGACRPCGGACRFPAACGYC